MKYLAIPPPERSLPQDQVVTESSVLVALLVSKMMSSGMLVDLSDEYLGVYLNQRSVLYAPSVRIETERPRETTAPAKIGFHCSVYLLVRVLRTSLSVLEVDPPRLIHSQPWLTIVDLCHEHRRPSIRSPLFAISLPARLSFP
jgi:hypothetical protein